MTRFGFDAQRNRLLAGVREGRPPSYVRILLYVVSLIALVLLISVVLGVVVALAYLVVLTARGVPIDVTTLQDQLTQTLSSGVPFLVLSAPQFLVFILWTWFWVRVVERRPLRSIGLRRGRALRQWLRGLAVGAGLFLVAVLLIVPSGGLEWRGPAPAGIGSALLWMVVMFLFFLFQGPAEEIVTRGYVLPALTARASLLAGIIASSALFGAAHFLNPHVSWLAFVNLILFGVFAAFYALREQALWGVFGIHTAWNWVQGSVLGLPVSGQTMTDSPLLKFMTGRPDWWSGGAFGPEGGLTVTVVLVAAALTLLLWKRLRPPEQIGGER